jgi:hypothetical protein
VKLICVALFLLICASIVLTLGIADEVNRRMKRLEHIVGTEVPASMTWTNGHTYSTIVKHSANCPCVKK